MAETNPHWDKPPWESRDSQEIEAELRGAPPEAEALEPQLEDRIKARLKDGRWAAVSAVTNILGAGTGGYALRRVLAESDGNTTSLVVAATGMLLAKGIGGLSLREAKRADAEVKDMKKQQARNERN
jgi:hypothetical protein